MPVEMIGWLHPGLFRDHSAEEPAFSADVVARARIHEDAISTGSLLAIFGCAGWIHPWRARGECDRTLGLPFGASAGVCGTTVAARSGDARSALRRATCRSHHLRRARWGSRRTVIMSTPRPISAQCRLCRHSAPVWTETHPFDHKGEFYKFEAACNDIRCASDRIFPFMAVADPMPRSISCRLGWMSSCWASRWRTRRHLWRASATRQRPRISFSLRLVRSGGDRR